MVAMIECDVAIMTASMPGVTVFVRWVRGDTLEHGKPERESESVGHRRRRGSGITGTMRGEEEEYVMHGMIRSSEVLVEHGT